MQPFRPPSRRLKPGLEPSKLATLDHLKNTHSSTTWPDWHFAPSNLGIFKAGYSFYFLLCYSKTHWSYRKTAQRFGGETPISQWGSFLSQLDVEGDFLEFLKYSMINAEMPVKNLLWSSRFTQWPELFSALTCVTTVELLGWEWVHTSVCLCSLWSLISKAILHVLWK